MKTTVITMGTLIRKNTFNGLRKVTLALKERVGEKQISRYLSGKVANTIPQSMFEDMKEGNVFLATGTLAYSEYETDDGKEKTSLEPTYLNFVPVCKDDLEFATDNAGNSVLIGGINEVTLEGGLTKDVEGREQLPTPHRPGRVGRSVSSRARHGLPQTLRHLRAVGCRGS
jgi:hypothetical protein